MYTCRRHFLVYQYYFKWNGIKKAILILCLWLYEIVYIGPKLVLLFLLK